jgi:hypothetical protein
VPARYQGVHRYAQQRQQRRRDVYGWYPADDGTAVLQVDPGADDRTFPDEIDGVRLRLWKAPPPE